MMAIEDTDLWKESRELVASELTRLNRNIEGLNERLDKVGTELHIQNTKMAVLRSEFNIKSGLWGFLAGAVPAAIAIVYEILHK